MLYLARRHQKYAILYVSFAASDRSLPVMKTDTFIQTPLASASFESKYPCEVGVKIDWPISVRHDGVMYVATGKTGVRNEDQMPSAEYKHIAPGLDLRGWLDPQGNFKPE